MKKVINVFVILILLAFPALSQNNTKITVDSSNVTINRVYSDVKAGMEGLGKALKVGAEHVYFVMIKQQIVLSVTNTLVYIILFTISILCISNFRKNFKRTQNQQDSWYKDDLDDHFAISGMLAISIVITMVSITIFLATITETITGFVNPEYSAIKEILKFIK